MIKRTFYLKFIVSIVFISFALFANTVLASSKASIAEKEYNFGKVIDGTPVIHNFVIENQGDAELVIKKVRASCGCTTVDYTKHIAAGQKGNIKVKFYSDGYGGRKVQKSIKVETNEPDNNKITLYLKGEVEEFAIIKPRRIFITGAVGKFYKGSVTIKPIAKYPFKILEVKGNDSDFEYKIEKKLDSEQNSYYVFTVKNKKTEAGRYKHLFELKTDSDVKDSIIVPVFVEIN